eukprot:4121509-Prorocentrum_lima.AAC.1
MWTASAQKNLAVGFSWRARRTPTERGMQIACFIAGQHTDGKTRTARDYGVGVPTSMLKAWA